MARALLACVAAVGLVSGCVVTTEVPAPSPDGGQPSAQQSAGDGYRFIHTRDDGTPIRWSTCEPIRYVVRPDGQPEGAGRLLEESIARISEATGLEFSSMGTTDEAPAMRRQLYQPDRYGDRWAPVLIGYSDEEELPRLQGRAAGYGGPAYVQPGNGVPRYVSGQVVFDTEELARMGGEDSTRGVMLHELAHLVGLGHVDDRGQLMNPVLYGREVTTLQEGDLAGLELLGDGRCYDPVAPRRFRG